MIIRFVRPALTMALAFLLAVSSSGQLAAAQAQPRPDFGADTGSYLNDGECDDPRFIGDLATTAGEPLTDASDCRKLWNAGVITLRASVNADVPVPEFGDDSGEYVDDGDCDDVRFEGYNTTTAGRVGTDASDCRTLWEAGLISLRARLNEGLDAPDFGEDSGQYTLDIECDDPRFTGHGASTTGTPLTDATDCAAAWAAGTITIYNQYGSPPLGMVQSTGTGFSVSATGHVLTNAHVVEGCSAIHSPMFGKLDLLASDPVHDLALLQASTPTASFAAISGAQSARLGEEVMAAGFPLYVYLKRQSVTISVGTVSARTGLNNDTKEFQISAAVQSGNSGGPVFNRKGEVVGVVVSKINEQKMLEETNDLPQNINFAVSLAAVNRFLSVNTVPINRTPDFAADSIADIAEHAEGLTGLIECLSAPAEPLPEFLLARRGALSAYDFGNDSGEWANDRECDDPRFIGPGASTAGVPRTDASDCRHAWMQGTIALSDGDLGSDVAAWTAGAITFDGVTFGSNASPRANDGECDDPRFKGEGMAEILSAIDLKADATDCLALFARGKIELAE